MVDLAPQAAAQADAAATPSTRRYYVLALLTVVYALNFLDRTIFNVLIEPIKKEFTLSDTTMGLLAGFGFVLFYSLLGIPIARVADRLNRRNIVAMAFAFFDESFTGKLLGKEPRATVEAVRMGKKFMFASSARAERELGFKVLPIYNALRGAIEWFIAHGYAPATAKEAR